MSRVSMPDLQVHTPPPPPPKIHQKAGNPHVAILYVRSAGRGRLSPPLFPSPRPPKPNINNGLATTVARSSMLNLQASAQRLQHD